MQQAPVIAGTTQPHTQLGQARAKANELKLRATELEIRKNQLGEQKRRLSADVDPSAIDRQLVEAELKLASTRIELESMTEQIEELQTERDMSRAFSLAPPPPPPGEPIIGPDQITTVFTGGVVLLLPFVIVLARRLWVRGVRREVIDLENSPRLQRIEQAVEAIALEVERIGEAQRFTTKLLSERQADAAPRIPVPRREPGTITPH